MGACRLGLPGITQFGANDDNYVQSLLGFWIKFGRYSYDRVYLSNNGYITFGSGTNDFIPDNLIDAGPLVAAFHADVDTRPVGATLVRYGQTVVGGRPAWAANWFVGYYSYHRDKVNTFQMVIRSKGVTSWELELNYDQIQWEAGQASVGYGDRADPLTGQLTESSAPYSYVAGIGGWPARVGWYDGLASRRTYTPVLRGWYEFENSGVSGAFLDSNPNGLVHHSYRSDVLGRYVFAGSPVLKPGAQRDQVMFT